MWGIAFNVYIMKRQPCKVSCECQIHGNQNNDMEVAMSPYDYEIGLDLHKEFSMLAPVDTEGKCSRYDRVENIAEHLDHYFSQIKGSFRVTFESTRNWYWLADCLLRCNNFLFL